MSHKRVVIVGGGVVGMCSAYYALKRGFHVTLVEREQVGGDNCSMGNAGMVVPSHFVPLAAPGVIAKGLRWMLNAESPFYVRPRMSLDLMQWGWLFWRNATERHVMATREMLRDLNLESRRLFDELNQEEGFGLEKKGLLMLCSTNKGLDEEAIAADAAAEIGLNVKVLDSEGVAMMDPSITMNVVGGVHYADDCHLDPQQFMKSMRQRVIEMGGVIESGVRIRKVNASDGRVLSVVSDEQTYQADEFVIAGGSWSNDLLSSLGVRLPLQAGKGYSLTLENPPELPALCSIFAEAKVAITPMGRRLRFGGTMEVCDNDLRVNPNRVRGIVKSVAQYFPKFAAEVFDGVEPWAGLRPISPDGVPYLGRLKSHENLLVATGHAMMGLSLGPVSGRLVADLLARDVPFRSIDAMALDRF